jgi:hypothetical protein
VTNPLGLPTPEEEQEEQEASSPLSGCQARQKRKSSFLACSPYSNDDEHRRSITVVDEVFVFRAEKFEDDLA